jgi:uncharacterized protein YoxC
LFTLRLGTYEINLMTTPTEDRLDRIERVVEVLVNQQREVLGRVDGLSHRVDSLTDRVDNLSQSVSKLSADVDKLGFKFDTAQSVGERLERLATSLIAGATISIIAGVILVLLREGSR